MHLRLNHLGMRSSRHASWFSARSKRSRSSWTSSFSAPQRQRTTGLSEQPTPSLRQEFQSGEKVRDRLQHTNFRYASTHRRSRAQVRSTKMSAPTSANDDGLSQAPEATLPPGVDRRAFIMRNAVIGAAAVMTGKTWTSEARAQQAAKEATQAKTGGSAISPDLDVVKKSKGPVMTVLEEFYKVGPGPSSSHTIGPMRITYDFYQRCTKLPADQLAKATGLNVHLYGSLSATGKGHGTERASLAALIGKEPATIDPAFLDDLAANPDQTFPVKLGSKTFNASLQDIIYDATKGNFPHPNTMTCKLMVGDTVLHELEYYSVGGGFIEWKGYQPPKKGQPKYPYSTIKELQKHAE